MPKEYLLKRIKELGNAITESAENHQRLRVMIENATNSHNALVGRLEEANALYEEVSRREEVPVVVAEYVSE